MFVRTIRTLSVLARRIVLVMASAALETYKATRKAMYLVLSMNTFMLGQAFIGNDPKLKMKNPLENCCNITTFFDTIQSFFIGIPQKNTLKRPFI